MTCANHINSKATPICREKLLLNIGPHPAKLTLLCPTALCTTLQTEKEPFLPPESALEHPLRPALPFAWPTLPKAPKSPQPHGPSLTMQFHH